MNKEALKSMIQHLIKDDISGAKMDLHPILSAKMSIVAETKRSIKEEEENEYPTKKNKLDNRDYDDNENEGDSQDIGGGDWSDVLETKNRKLIDDYMDKNVPTSFDCSGLNLTTLEGCPKKVSKNFYAGSNKNLKSLEHCPDVTGRIFNFTSTNIKSLEGIGERYCLSVGKGMEINEGIISNILGLLKIKKLKAVYTFNLEPGKLLKAINILNRYLVPGPDLRNIEKCKKELIEAGLSNFAKE